MSISRRLLALVRDSRLALVATILAGFLAGLLIIGQASALSQVVDGVFIGGQGLTDVWAVHWMKKNWIAYQSVLEVMEAPAAVDAGSSLEKDGHAP